MVAYAAAMTASLATKLSLGKHEEPVDLGDLGCPAKGSLLHVSPLWVTQYCLGNSF